MRKVIAATIGVAALTVVPLSLTATPALADPGISQVCNQNNDFQLSHGACVNVLSGNEHSGALVVSVCKLIQQQLPEIFDTSFKNLGECVSLLHINQPTPTQTPSPTPTPTPTPTPMV